VLPNERPKLDELLNENENKNKKPRPNPDGRQCNTGGIESVAFVLKI
jgi:hypothetical protein